MLLNEVNNMELEVVDPAEEPLHKITEEEVEMVLKGMKNGRAARPPELSSDILKYAENS